VARRFIFEHRTQPVLPYRLFVKRMFNSAFLALILLGVTITIGATGYHGLEGQAWIDAVLNAVMIMSGLGLQGSLQTSAGKIFTTFFAVFSAFVFYSALAILFSPPLHRLLHHFHLNKKDND
jgi:sterol desaturase/sphingolipid hydroxylase (fatty acid hydroxylase superfamily)